MSLHGVEVPSPPTFGSRLTKPDHCASNLFLPADTTERRRHYCQHGTATAQRRRHDVYEIRFPDDWTSPVRRHHFPLFGRQQAAERVDDLDCSFPSRHVLPELTGTHLHTVPRRTVQTTGPRRRRSTCTCLAAVRCLDPRLCRRQTVGRGRNADTSSLMMSGRWNCRVDVVFAAAVEVAVTRRGMTLTMV